MKSILLVCVAACLFSTAFAQNDTTIKKETDTTIKKETNDTIRIGGMIIIKKPGSEDREIITHDHHTVHISHRRTPENLTTNWSQVSMIKQIISRQKHRLLLPEAMKIGLILRAANQGM